MGSRCLSKKTLAISMLLSPRLLAAEPITLTDIIDHLQATRAATDLRGTGRLVRIAESGERKNYKISLRAKAFDDGLWIFCEVTDPEPARVRLLFESISGARASIRVGHAGDSAAKNLPFEDWAEGLLGTDVSYEDLLESQFLWQKQTLLEDKKYGAREVYAIRSQPGPADKTHYSSVTSWLDRKSYYPVRVEKTLMTSGLVKEFIYSGLRESKGVWSASQIEFRMKGAKASTLLIINRGAEKAHLDRASFDPKLLIKP